MVPPVEYKDRSAVFLFLFANIAFLIAIATVWSTAWIVKSVVAGDWQWFARSGSITVIIGGVLSSRSVLRLNKEARGAIISKVTIFNQIPDSELKNRKEDASAVAVGVLLMLTGTLIW